ncbi:MAG: hydrogenase maturation protease [Anaerolineales bacterium]|nr:hydrogenase maturation protease [Anaerolineales bacterium]
MPNKEILTSTCLALFYEKDTMNKTVVIGIGNPLRGDDGVGWAVVDALDSVAAAWGITAVRAHQLLPELIDVFCQASQVIFVDASVAGEPGTITVTPIQPAIDGPAASHQMHPGVLLALGLKLYGRMPPAYLITITGLDFGYQETLSALVQQSVSLVLDHIRQLVDGSNLPTASEFLANNILNQ